MPALGRYGVILWIEGEESIATLSADRQRSRQDYWTAGGRLVLAGQSVAKDPRDEPFLAALGAGFVRDAVRTTEIAGAPAARDALVGRLLGVDCSDPGRP